MDGASERAAAAEPGILHPAVAQRRFDYQRHQPSEQLAPFVENIWTVTWDLAGTDPYTAQVLPYPSVNLSVTNEGADVTGVTSCRYDRQLVGRGYVVGARFRPGCFHPFLGSSVSRLTDSARPISEVLGRGTRPLQRSVATAATVGDRAQLLTRFLLDDLPARDPIAEMVAELVEHVAVHAEIRRVSQLAGVACMSDRRLHRLFVEYVGAGPKWVIARCRLQDAAARAAADPGANWGALAAELGFADQAHLTRAFTKTIGLPPATYAARASGDS
ncbi:MAG TPA: helix-turn-helix domain-containing protein [Propionibacteriaceae bacterium]|jgi:AraC-like DNA-binding protein